MERIEEAPGYGGGLVRETRPANALRAASTGPRQIDHRRSTGSLFSNAISSVLVLAAWNLSGRSAEGRHTHLPERSVLDSRGERPGER